MEIFKLSLFIETSVWFKKKKEHLIPIYIPSCLFYSARSLALLTKRKLSSLVPPKSVNYPGFYSVVKSCSTFATP